LCAIAVTAARGVQGACPARRPADPPLLSGPGTATGGLDGTWRAPPWASSLGAKLLLWSTKRCVVDGFAKSLPAPAFARDSIEWTRSMSYLLSSVDPVLYCDINGPTHAPTVLSLARSATSVFDSSLGSLRIAPVRTYSSCVVIRIINCALLRSLSYQFWEAVQLTQVTSIN
jgi:hypothetical protein